MITSSLQRIWTQNCEEVWAALISSLSPLIPFSNATQTNPFSFSYQSIFKCNSNQPSFKCNSTLTIFKCNSNQPNFIFIPTHFQMQLCQSSEISFLDALKLLLHDTYPSEFVRRCSVVLTNTYTVQHSIFACSANSALWGAVSLSRYNRTVQRASFVTGEMVAKVLLREKWLQKRSKSRSTRKEADLSDLLLWRLFQSL